MDICKKKDSVAVFSGAQRQRRLSFLAIVFLSAMCRLSGAAEITVSISGGIPVQADVLIDGRVQGDVSTGNSFTGQLYMGLGTHRVEVKAQTGQWNEVWNGSPPNFSNALVRIRTTGTAVKLCDPISEEENELEEEACNGDCIFVPSGPLGEPALDCRASISFSVRVLSPELTSDPAFPFDVKIVRSPEEERTVVLSVRRATIPSFPGGPSPRPDFDSDGDCLMDDDEATLGTHPWLADTDGDGLTDGVEVIGYMPDANQTCQALAFNPAQYGADPLHKDIFVEIDYMVEPGSCSGGNCSGGHTHKPESKALEKVVQAFLDAPVDNPDGNTGISLHIDAGPASTMNPLTGDPWGVHSQSKPIPHSVSLGSFVGDDYDPADYVALKSAHFSPDRASVFRYCAFVHDIGFTTISGIAGAPGSDFIVSLGSRSNMVGTDLQQAGTLMHELGHTLGLLHGGQDSMEYKPNYLSVMNYSFQEGGLIRNTGAGHFDYSQFGLSSFIALDEKSLNEFIGLDGPPATNVYGTKFFNGSNEIPVGNINSPIDWDDDTNNSELNVGADINKDSSKTVLMPHEDWSQLVFEAGSIGGAGSTIPLEMFNVTDELTREEASLLRTEFGVSVSPAGPYELSPGTSATFATRIRNIGDTPDQYSLTTQSSRNWTSIPGLPATIELLPNEEVEFIGSIVVPASAASGSADEFELEAISLNNPRVIDMTSVQTTTVGNPPVANAGNDQTVEGAGTSGTMVVLDGRGSTSAPGRDLSYRWTGPFSEGGGVVTGATPQVTLPLGDHVISLVVNDGAGDSLPDTTIVRVVDTTAPKLVLFLTPNTLWPPNHKMIRIAVQTTATDACDPSPMIELVSIQMNEGQFTNTFYPETDDEVRDGTTGGDIQIDPQGQIYLRAERSGNGPGRTYSIAYIAQDASGNETIAHAEVKVPHSR